MGTVLRLTFRNLAANPVRFILTSFAVFLGVSFVVASFVLADGLRSTFDSLVEDVNADIDAQVLAASDFEEIDFVDSLIDEGALEIVRGVEGVGEAHATASSGKIIPIGPDGDVLETFGPPILTFNWLETELSPITLVEGDPPVGPGEFAVDEGTVDREGFELGETYDLIGVDGREPFKMVGITRFGESNTLAGATLMSMDIDELQRLDGSEGKIVQVDVAAAAGVEPEELIADLNIALPEELEAVGIDVVIDEDKEDFSSFVDIFGTILLTFAAVSVFVSAFIINNTFNIILSQRVRQLALLRALGASGRQVRFSSILEATLIGLIASALGIVGGVLLAYGLRWLMNLLGFSLPSLEVIVSARTVIVAVIVGMGVTLAASLSPSRKAATVPPVAAMRGQFRFGSGEGTRRTIVGVIIGLLGVVGLVFGLFGSLDTSVLLLMLGISALLVFVAVAMLTPLFSTPVARFLGKPLEWLPWLGFAGHLARENSARNNKRTAQTASALMIGLALVAMATVVATSLKDSFRASLSSTLTADYLVTTNGPGFSGELFTQIDALPEFGAVSSVRFGTMRIDGDEKSVSATDVTLMTSLLDIELQEGDPAAGANTASILITTDAAEDNGVGLGDDLAVEFATGGFQFLTVEAIYENDFLIGNYVIDLSTWDENFSVKDDQVVAAALSDGTNVETADAALDPIREEYPQLDIETRDEFRERQEGTLDSLLVIINVFLGLAIVIALLGITNTMALSVFERTREIGVMRAVGMTRRQTRSLIRWEAVVVSLLGALLGAVVGVAFGWVAVQAIPDSVIDQLAIPWGTLIIYVLVATLAGLIAASLPARRAARLNVLEAISHE